MRYYQVVMTIDIFQYSNMYTLRKNVQWLADEHHVRDECGPYVTKPGNLRDLACMCVFFFDRSARKAGPRLAQAVISLHSVETRTDRVRMDGEP